jgi:16S rRNA (guanine527-N7)-methyltransferase
VGFLGKEERQLLDQGLFRARLDNPILVGEQLDLLAEELLRWNRVHNLTGHSDARQVVVNLFLDALVLLPYLSGKTLLDIGSGAGFPGLVLALARPELEVTLLEPRAKRISFQRRMVGQLSLEDRVRPVQGRSPETEMVRSFGTVTLRAVGNLQFSLDLALPYLAPGGVILLSRGSSTTPELEIDGFEVHPYTLPPPGGARLVAVFHQKSPH